MERVKISPDFSQWSQRTTLEGVEYLLVGRWNSAEGAWYLSVYDSDGAGILLGAKVVSNWPITRRLKTTIPGVLVSIDRGNAVDLAEDPGLSDFGDRVSLIYLTSDEREAARPSTSEYTAYFNPGGD